MKVVFVPPNALGFNFGGGEVQTLATRRALEDLGVSVRPYDPWDRELFHKIDLVHLFGAPAAHSTITKVLVSRGIPYVVSSIFYVPEGRLRLIVRRALTRLRGTTARMVSQMLRDAALVLPNSTAEAEMVRLCFGVAPERLHVIPNGVDPAYLGDGEGFRRQFLSEFVREEERFVLSVGRIQRHKNTLSLLRAALRCGVKVLLIGKPDYSYPETAHTDRALKVVSQYPDRIRHVAGFPLGSRELADAYAAAHVHALVSHSETTGLVSLEAGLNGANLLVGECKPVREYFEGIADFADSRDESDIANQLAKAIARPRNAFGQAQVIAEKFSWRGTGTRTLAAYRTALEAT